MMPNDPGACPLAAAWPRRRRLSPCADADPDRGPLTRPAGHRRAVPQGPRRRWLPRSAASSAALGYDGKWVLHPTQIEAVNQAFAPSAADYSRAVRIIEAYAQATMVDQRGAVMLGDEMIDEASRKMAQAIVARGRAAGLPAEA